MNFLLPDYHQDTYPSDHPPASYYGDILVKMFDEYYVDSQVRIKYFDEVMSFFQKKNVITGSVETDNNARVKFVENQIIVIQSDGALTVDDSYMIATRWRAQFVGHSVNTIPD